MTGLNQYIKPAPSPRAPTHLVLLRLPSDQVQLHSMAPLAGILLISTVSIMAFTDTWLPFSLLLAVGPANGSELKANAHT